MIIEPVRFPYGGTQPERSNSGSLAYLPITLINGNRSLAVLGLLDSGSTVSVLPRTVGLQLGLLWEEQPTPIYLTGSLAKLPARGVIIEGVVGEFSRVELAFAWTQADNVPILLGQMNFFMEFNVCFFRAKLEFEIKPK
jgi:hypothetical protein